MIPRRPYLGVGSGISEGVLPLQHWILHREGRMHHHPPERWRPVPGMLGGTTLGSCCLALLTAWRYFPQLSSAKSKC
jgi:hypothetical protein